MKSEKEQTPRRKPKETEVAFAKGDDDGPRGFGHRKGKCRICNKEGHHGWECPDKDKDKNDKDKDESKQPASKTETGKVTTGTTLVTHGSSTSDEYNSDDEYGQEDLYGIMFMTVGISEVMPSGKEEGVLDLLQLEHTFGQSDNNSSPIPEDWCILDNQSTVDVFRNKKYLILMCQVIFPLDRFPFFANLIVLVLSSFNKLSLTRQPCPSIKYKHHIFFGMPSEIATVSVSVELNVLIFCFHDADSTAPCPNVITNPVCPLMSGCTACAPSLRK